MTPIDRRVAEHVAIGHVGGFLSRREALRRLALLGIGVASANALIAACGDKAPAAGPAPAAKPVPAAPPLAPAQPAGHVADSAGGWRGPPKAYNWTASNTQRLRASLSNATTSRINHVFIGDSLTAGYLGGVEIPPYDALVAWPRVYRASLQARGFPVAGTGLVPCISGNAPYDSRWTRSTGWDASLAYTLFVKKSGKTATFVSDTPGTEVSVYYFGNSAGMNVSVDGGPTSALPVDGIAHARVFTITRLPNAVHTVAITTTTDSYNQMVGASTQGGNGLVCHNIAVGGATASGPNLAAWGTAAPIFINSTLVGSLTAASIDPDVVYVALGGDDITAGYSLSQIVDALTGLRNQFSSSDFVLIGENEFDGYQSVWPQWLRTLYALADTLNCPLVDLYDRYGEYSDAVTGQFMGDGMHLNAKAQDDVGRTIAALACSLQ